MKDPFLNVNKAENLNDERPRRWLSRFFFSSFRPSFSPWNVSSVCRRSRDDSCCWSPRLENKRKKLNARGSRLSLPFRLKACLGNPDSRMPRCFLSLHSPIFDSIFAKRKKGNFLSYLVDRINIKHMMNYTDEYILFVFEQTTYTCLSFRFGFVSSIDRSIGSKISSEKRGGRKEDRYGNLSELPWRNAFSFGARGNSLTRSRRGQRKDDEGGLLTSKVWFTVASILDPR